MTAPVQVTAPWLPQINADADVVVSMTAYILGILAAYEGLQPPVLVQRGERQTTSSLKTKYPVEAGSPLFQKVTGGSDYREIGNLMLEVATPEPWEDAVKALVLRMQSNEWTGWGKQPLMVAEAANLIGELAIVQAIEAGEATPSADNFVDGDTYDKGYRFFQQNRPCDPLGNGSGVKSNLFTGAGTAALGNTDAAAPMNLATIDRVWQHIRSVKSQNGVYAQDLTWVATLVPTAMELKARRYFEELPDNATIYEPTTGTADNKSAAGVDVFPKPNTARKYKIEVIASPYLTSDTTWYPICQTRTIKTWPWLELTQVPKRQVEFAGAMQPSPSNSNGGGDLIWTIDAMDSHFFKHGKATDVIPAGYVGIKALKRVSAALLWFDQMFKCKAA